MALKLKKIEFHLPKNTLCHVWLKLAEQFRRRLSNFLYIFNFLLLSPLRKLVRSFIWKKLIPLTQGCSVPSLVEIDLVVLEKKLSDCMYFHFVASISLWQRAWSFKCQVWWNLTWWFWRSEYVKKHAWIHT